MGSRQNRLYIADAFQVISKLNALLAEKSEQQSASTSGWNPKCDPGIGTNELHSVNNLATFLPDGSGVLSSFAEY